MKPGTKLKSVVCETEVMVIRCANDSVIECGGKPMSDTPLTGRGRLDPAHGAGTQIGKRYADASGIVEVLCVKPGQGSLSIAAVALKIKDAKPLPSSD